MERVTNIAQTIEMAAEQAKYDDCAKRLLSYEAIIAWILKECTREFSKYSVKFIMANCLRDKPEISVRAVHQDQPDKKERLDGDSMVDKANSESTSINEGTVYYDIRLRAYLPNVDEPIIIYINLEIQLDDKPGYPIIKRALYYCARMLSEQYGTEFTKEHYERLRKVYSIWICPTPAQKRQNTILRYHMAGERVFGNVEVDAENSDLLEAVIINLGEAEKQTDNDILNLLNALFSDTMPPEEKKKVLSEDFNIAMTEKLESEVQGMCNISEGLVRKGEVIGEKRGVIIGRKEGEVIGEKRGKIIGREEGEVIGRKEGKIDERTETIKNMISKGKTPEEISDWCGYDLDFVKEVAEGKLQTV
jgi:predicted transposase/invertase (TIGR01784 family)